MHRWQTPFLCASRKLCLSTMTTMWTEYNAICWQEHDNIRERICRPISEHNNSMLWLTCHHNHQLPTWCQAMESIRRCKTLFTSPCLFFAIQPQVIHRWAHVHKVETTPGCHIELRPHVLLILATGTMPPIGTRQQRWHLHTMPNHTALMTIVSITVNFFIMCCGRGNSSVSTTLQPGLNRPMTIGRKYDDVTLLYFAWLCTA